VELYSSPLFTSSRRHNYLFWTFFFLLLAVNNGRSSMKQSNAFLLLRFQTAVKVGNRRRPLTNNILAKMHSTAESQRNIFTTLYISEGRNSNFVRSMLDAAKVKTEGTSECALISHFSDTYYNRTSLTVAGKPSNVTAIVQELAEIAIGSLDLRNHTANHPRIGVVDHISLHPLGHKDTSDAKDCALQLGKHFGEHVGIPILYYGDVNGKRLAAVRRATSYFSGGQDSSIEADEGPCIVPENLGVMCIGAVPPVLNYNIRFKCTDRKTVSKITKQLREKDGGLSKVEAITLEHKNGFFEAACNLLDIDETSPGDVLQLADQCATSLNIEVDEAYTIGYTPQQIAEKYHCKIMERKV